MFAQKQIKKIIFFGTAFLLFGLYSPAFAEDNRNTEVDTEVGGMEEGSRIPTPERNDVPQPPSPSSTPSDNKPKPSVKPARKKIPHYISIPTEGPSTEKTDIRSNAIQDKVGEKENQQIFKEDMLAEEILITPVDTVQDTTESKDTGTVGSGTTDETVPDEPKEIAQESVPPDPIIDADVKTDLESGTIETEVAVDTSGQLEEKQILDADIKAGETASAETEVGSAVDITQSDIVKEADVTTEPVTQPVVSAPSELVAGIDSTGGTTGAETDVGLEADLSGTSEDEEVACDEPDGILPGSCKPLVP